MEVAIIIGSDSDWNIMKKAVEVLNDFNIEVELTVASAHRTPERVKDFVTSCDKQGAKIFIAAAGMAAHLAGVVASYTTHPVIGVPINSEPLKGFDALLSTVQMPGGVPVATMAINGAKNAALFAAEILATNNAELKQQLDDYRASMVKEVEQKAETVQRNFHETKK